MSNRIKAHKYVQIFCKMYQHEESVIGCILTEIVERCYSQKRIALAQRNFETLILLKDRKENYDIIEKTCKEYQGKVYFGTIDFLIEMNKLELEDILEEFQEFLHRSIKL